LRNGNNQGLVQIGNEIFDDYGDEDFPIDDEVVQDNENA
jgi:hypothetical protein